MAKFPKLFPIVMLVSLLSLPIIARAADEPVATAAIPPPLPAVSSAAAPAATPTAPKAAKAPKRIARPKALPGTEPAKRAVAQKPSRHVKRERHLLFARVYPPPRTPARPRYYYPGAPVADAGSDGPPFPPSWYDRYPNPRGPW
jgi:hypothetical protein